MEHLEQEECAKNMGISRPTFQRILTLARKKIADSIINGKALRIEGGNYELATEQYRKRHENIKDNPKIAQENMEVKHMKIAVVTENEVTISQHFGRAPLYEVFTIENGKISGKEKRSKVGHNQFAGQHEQHTAQGGQHGFDPASQNRHAGMAETISDCQVIIAGGMGMGAYESLKSYKIEPIITDVQDMEEAVSLFIQGNLPNLMERLH
jgi:predicted Fe-Mo cluster-binding NifX family protein